MRRRKRFAARTALLVVTAGTLLAFAIGALLATFDREAVRVRNAPVELLEIDPLRVADRFRGRLHSLGGTEYFHADGCVLAIVIDPACHGCDVVARSVVAAGPALVDTVWWISVAGLPETRAFAARNQLPAERMLVTDTAPDLPPGERLIALGMSAVPMQVVLSPRGIVKDLRVRLTAPDPDSVRFWCHEAR